MKRLIVATMMVFLVTAGVFADEAQRPITGGKVGLSFFTGEKILDLVMSEGSLRSSLVDFTGVSLVYHVTESFALEPAVFFSYMDTTYTNNSGQSNTDDNMMAGGALGIFYFHNLSGGAYMYIGPRVDYLRMEETDKDTDGSYDETKTNSFGASLVIGLKYMFNAHVGVFGDISAGYFVTQQDYYDYNTSGVQTSHTDRETNTILLTKGLLGVTLYF